MVTRHALLGLLATTLGWSSPNVQAMSELLPADCHGLLSASSYQVLINHRVFISQFSPGIQRCKTDAMCVLVAAANAAQALYFNLTGQAVYPELLIDFVNEAWASFTEFPEVRADKGIPFIFHPAIALGAAQQVKLLDKVVPVGYSDPHWIAANPEEVVSTRSRVRVLGVRTNTGAHSVLSLGMDPQTKEVLVLDPNDATQIRRLKLQAKDKKLYLSQTTSASNVVPLRKSLEFTNADYEILSVFGLNIKEELRSANDP